MKIYTGCRKNAYLRSLNVLILNKFCQYFNRLKELTFNFKIRNTIRNSMLILFVCFFPGCAMIIPTPNVLPVVNFECKTLNSATNKRLSGVKINVVYTNPRGNKSLKYGPFVTDKNGKCTVSVDKKIKWIKGVDAYFIGGYTRNIYVSHGGFYQSIYGERFFNNYKKLEENSVITFKLNPIKNQFGVVKIVAHEIFLNENYQLLSIDVLNGPNKGEHFKILSELNNQSDNLTGKTMYLKKSLDEIKQNAKNPQIIASNYLHILRQGIPIVVPFGDDDKHN